MSPIARQKEHRVLLLNSEKLASTKNAVLRPGTVSKHLANPLFIEDKPWEQRYDNLYGNILYDADEALYKCWYSPFIVANASHGMSLAERKQKPYSGRMDQEMGICYATSIDGIHWQKPELNTVQFGNDTNNNLVWREPHGAGIFKDQYELDESKRYKMLFQQPNAGLSVSFSRDGLEWSSAVLLEGVEAAGDTHNNALWAPTENKYVAFTRTWEQIDRKLTGPESKTNHNYFRQVARMESTDFIHWSQPEVVMRSPSWERQVYAMPVFFHGGVYLGLLAVHDQAGDRVWTELAWSANTEDWHRLEPDLAVLPNSETELDYDYGCVYACAYPIFDEDKVSLYYGGSDWLHFGWRNGCLALATLRPDGFAGWEQENSDSPAEVRTKLIDYSSGDELRVSADIDVGGSIKYVIRDQQSTVISRGELQDTCTDRVILNRSEAKTPEIDITFTFTRAKIYSYSFA